LAFGNGAPDVFSSLSAASSIDSAAAATLGSGFYLAASGSIGGGLFVSQIVASVIALMAKPQTDLQVGLLVLGGQQSLRERQINQASIQVNPMCFYRDVLFYLASILTLMYAIFIR
jgi:Ca2+/Na+ antiporter